MITLKNQFLTVEIDPKGAQLCSVKGSDGTEYIWQADPEIWPRHAPLLFPFIGRLLEGKYTYEGKEYSIGTHGFCRDALFTVEEHDASTAVFSLVDNDERRAAWPFAFKLTVTFTLQDNKLIKSCRVDNPGDEPMYFELGSHDGFIAPLSPGEVMDDYAIVIPGMDTLRPYHMNEACLVAPKQKEYPLTDGRINLKPYHYDGIDTLIMDDMPQRKVLLVNKAGRARVTVECEDYRYLALWTQDRPFDTNYVCIEPWTTLPEASFVGRDLTEKAGVERAEPHQSRTFTYTTTFD